MSNKIVTILDDIAKAPEEVLAWLGSPTGEAVVSIGETALETALPQVTGIVNIFNKYLTEAIKVETISVAAATQPGTASVQKAQAVVADVGPQVIAFAEANGLATPTADEILKLNNLAVEFLQVFKPAPAAPTPTTAVVPETTVTDVKVPAAPKSTAKPAVHV
jgi:hypothetical protein